MKSIKSYTLLVAIITMLISAACTEQQTENKRAAKPLKISTLDIKEQNIDISKSFFGEVKYQQHMTVVSELSGKVVNLNVKPGETVKKDDVLLTYPPQNHELDTQQAKLIYDELKRNYKRQLTLFKKGAIPQQALEELKTQLDVQEKRLKQANELYSIKAPFSGTITDVAVSTGNEVNTGEPLLSIAQMQQIETTFFVPSNIISSIELKAPVYMVIEGDTLMGRVSKKAMTMSSQNMAYRVKAKFKNQQNKIISGSTRQIFVHTQTLSNRIIIPWECIKQQGETNYVFINQDGKAQLKVIEIERIVGINAIIKTGLQPGDKLIINGIAKLKNAMPIEA